MTGPVVTRILAPVELDEHGRIEVAYAIGLAAQLRAELVFFAVIDTAATLGLVARHRVPDHGRADFEASLLREVEALLRDAVDRASLAGVRALGHARIHEAVEEQILKEALVQKVDLILVRASGRSVLMKGLLGSTAGEILKAAPCPVLVART